MIEITIRNAKELAERHSGHVSASTGRFMGTDVEGRIRNQVAKRIKESLDEGGIAANVSPSGARQISVDIKDTEDASWEQGYIAWAVSRVLPTSVVESQIADRLEEQLGRQGIDAETETSSKWF
jgi:hypothetical protein